MGAFRGFANNSPLSWAHGAAFSSPPKFNEALSPTKKWKGVLRRTIRKMGPWPRTQHFIQQSLKDSLVNHLPALISQGLLQQVATSR